MRFINLLLILGLVSQFICMPVHARPGEAVNAVLKRFQLEGQQPVTQGDYVSYKVNDSKFVAPPTVFFKIGANGIVLEENFLFDKNKIHERDVEKAKNDTRPTVSIPHHSYLVGDFSQLPREHFDGKSKAIGVVAAPFGAAAGTVVGAGRGLYEGAKIGMKTADSASRALGGDVSGKVGAWAASATAIATGAVTGLFAGFTGGAVEGSARGARVALEGVSGADRQITGATLAASPYVIIGGRIGKELTPEEQKGLLDQLAELENARLASNGLDKGNENDLAKNDTDSSKEKNKMFDTAQDKAGFDESSNYLSEDAANKNVAGMW